MVEEIPKKFTKTDESNDLNKREIKQQKKVILLERNPQEP
jgi:hypothetical protein